MVFSNQVIDTWGRNLINKQVQYFLIGPETTKIKKMDKMSKFAHVLYRKTGPAKSSNYQKSVFRIMVQFILITLFS